MPYNEKKDDEKFKKYKERKENFSKSYFNKDNPLRKSYKTTNADDDTTEIEKVSTNKGLADDELLYYGLHICETISKKRKDEIIKVFISKDISKDFSQLLSYCAKNKKAYKIVENKDIEKITGSVHHEGIAIIAKYKKVNPLSKLDEIIKTAPSPIIFIDGVANPHNIGIIMRLMANFGFKYIVGNSDTPELTAAAARMSEGGSEFVTIFRADNNRTFIKWAKDNNYTLVGTSSHTKKSLYQYQFPERTAIVLGHEVYGMSDELIRNADTMLIIPGTGVVESINVSTAASIFMGEYFRQIKC